MKDLKFFFKSILIFIPFSILMYLAFIIVVGGNMPFEFLKPNVNYRGVTGYMHQRINEIQDYKNVDILFLGSSHTYRGFDTRIFEEHGLRSFNLGSINQTFIQTDVLLERYLKLLNPKVIILEVSPMAFSSDGVESSMDIIANDRQDLLTLTRLVKWNNVKTINTAILGFYRDLVQANDSFIKKEDDGEDIYVSGGFVEKELMFYKPLSIKKEEIVFNNNQLTAFRRCINRIHSNSIKLILVQAPITTDMQTSYSNNQTFDKRMFEYGEYYNFNNLLSLNDSIHFFDSHHLNQNGVIIFNEKLISLLSLDSNRNAEGTLIQTQN